MRSLSRYKDQGTGHKVQRSGNKSYFMFLRLVLCALCLISFTFAGSAEDLSGIWKGTLTQGPGGCYPQYFIELQIRFSDNQVFGNTYDYYDTGKYVKLSFTGRYDPQTHRMVLMETKIIQHRIPADCVPCIKTYDLLYSKNGGEETLSGDWQGHIAGKQIACPPGKITLKKTSRSDFPTDIEQSDSLALIQESLHLEPRTKELVKKIIVDAGEIKIQLYDNAEIDDDSITVFVNGKLLLYRQRLTEKPLTIGFNAQPGTEYELLMYADNLGTIPPNTALMVVTAGKKKFELFLSSTEQKTAAVKFVYKRPD